MAVAVNDEDALEGHRASNAVREAQMPKGRINRAVSECALCEGEIEPNRLRILPTTKFCVECSREFEKMMKREAKWR